MEIGLITPPVGLNLYVINGIAPEISLPTILKGAFPFMLCMVLAIIIPVYLPWNCHVPAKLCDGSCYRLIPTYFF